MPYWLEICLPGCEAVRVLRAFTMSLSSSVSSSSSSRVAVVPLAKAGFLKDHVSVLGGFLNLRRSTRPVSRLFSFSPWEEALRMSVAPLCASPHIIDGPD